MDLGATPGPAVIRAAGPDDAPGITAVHVRGWQQGYAGLLPSDFLAGIDPAEREDRWRTILARAATGEQLVRVAELDGQVLGFVTGGPCRDAEPVAEHEVYALYVDPAAWGSGVASDLMAAHLQALPPAAVSLWVLAGNARARAFYARHGFVDDDATREEEFGSTRVMEKRMVLLWTGVWPVAGSMTR